jgi:hypothetical protein
MACVYIPTGAHRLAKREKRMNNAGSEVARRIDRVALCRGRVASHSFDRGKHHSCSYFVHLESPAAVAVLI